MLSLKGINGQKLSKIYIFIRFLLNVKYDEKAIHLYPWDQGLNIDDKLKIDF